MLLKDKRVAFMASFRAFRAGRLDMLHGSVWDKLLIFVLPLAFAGMLQQLYNAADVMVLGRFEGETAMAAAGSSTPFVSLLVNLFLGLSLGANVVTAQFLGAKKDESVRKAVNAAMGLAFASGIFLLMLGEGVSELAVHILEVPPEAEPDALMYLRVYLLGLPGIGLYNFTAAIYRSCGDTKTPLYALAISSAMNVVLDIGAAYVGFGVAGVAAATTISMTVSALLLIAGLMRRTDSLRVRLSMMTLNREHTGRMIRIGMPAAVQGMVFSISNLCVQSAINSLGTDAMAASAACFVIEANICCFINGFAQGATTFIGQNYGAGKLFRCRFIARMTVLQSSCFVLMMSIAAYVSGEWLIGWFTESSDVISLGMVRLEYVAIPEVVNCVLETLSASLRGYGLSLPPALLALFGVCGVRLAWVYIAFPVFRDFAFLMLCYPISWVVTAMLILLAYEFFIRHLPNKAEVL